MSAITPQDAIAAEDDATSLLDVALPLAANLKLLVLGPLLIGMAALGATYLVAPTFTAKTIFLPPQQQQSTAASAIASLGALSGLVGAAGGIKSPGDQYVSLMQSSSVADRLIDRFKLMAVYEAKYRAEARITLSKNVRISLGKKDGLISVEVEDRDPQRAAEMANSYVEELRRVTSELALTEAQQRRVFFETQLKTTRDQLVSAQQALQSSGFNAGALRAEPKAAAESYARLKAEATAAEVRLQTLRKSLVDIAPEVQQQQTLMNALRAQVAKLESSIDAPMSGDYVSRYREFKYQETLFDLFSRQYELARLDESREGALIQVVDIALPPERKSGPKRAMVAISATAFGAVLLLIGVLIRQSWKEAVSNPVRAAKLRQLRSALRSQ
jgi:uncharacterized protein involved in exopolysaccharide biosynthesis